MQINNNSAALSPSPKVVRPAPVGPVTKVAVSDNTLDASEPVISTLSRQLSDAAERAAVRDKMLTREEMKDLAGRLLAQLSSERYTQADMSKVFQRSSKDDPALIERDRQAVLFNMSAMRGENSVPNPFSGLSREQLVLIAYDETSTFTTNERHSAWRGISAIEYASRVDVIRRQTAGLLDEQPHLFYLEHLLHYRSLPLIEQAQYPDDYEDMLVADVVRTWTEKPSKDPERIRTLFEILAGQLKADDERPRTPDVSEPESASQSDSEPPIRTSS
ncbi:MAG: hypothetical protein K0R45_631 [Pseudomonas sp.]|jgi:hypothetical protein|nr:hypothetical protein [Pseudomonas sp.]